MISKLLLSLLLWDWMERAKQIRRPAPLPEEPVIPHLAKMLVPAPYAAPEKKAIGKAKGVRSGPRRKGASDVSSKDKTLPSTVEDNDEEEEESSSPPEGGGRRGRPPQIWRRRRPRRGKAPSRIKPRGTSTAVRSDAPGASPWPHRKY